MEIEQNNVIDENQYSIEVEKLMNSDVLYTHWSHNTYLLAIVTVENVLELYRVGERTQKVFQVESDKPITSVAFNPNSHLLVYGTKQGDTKLLKAQNGEVLLSVNDPLHQQITNLNFTQYALYPISKVLPFKQSPLLQKLILQITPHKNCNKSAIVKLNYFTQLHDEDMFTLLLASSERHTALHLNGFMIIAQIDYSTISQKHFGQQNQTKVLFSNYNTEKSKVEAVLVQNTVNEYVMHHVEFNSQILREKQAEIIKLTTIVGYISETINFLEQTYPAAEIFVRDIMRQYNQRMNTVDNGQQQGIDPCTQLFRFLNCGLTSPSLIHFFTKQLHDSKHLQKLDQSLNAIFNQLHDLFLQSIQNSLERAYLLLQQLKTLTSLDNYQQFNIGKRDIAKLQEMIEKLYTMGEVLLVQSTEAKFDIRNLLVWLNKATIKSASDPTQQTENTKSYLNRYTVDFTRLHKFLQTQHSFRLQNLNAFFTKTSQSKPLTIPQCQFQLLSVPKNINNPEYLNKTQQLQKLLDLDDIKLEGQTEKIEPQVSYRSFKLELMALKQQWKEVKGKPIKAISQKIKENYVIRKIDTVEASELVPFEPRFITKNKKPITASSSNHQQSNPQHLLIYYISPAKSTINYYSTLTHSVHHIKLPSTMQPLSVSVGCDTILLSQNPESLNQQKTITQVLNDEWQGEELVPGKTLDKISGEVHCNAGLKGFNLIVVNKNKLVAFVEE